MSFDKITNSDVQRKKQEIVIEVGKEKIKFYANELTFPKRLKVAVAENNGQDYFTQMIVQSITDQDGNYMTYEQAEKLSDEHLQTFFIAASEVNKNGEPEKN